MTEEAAKYTAPNIQGIPARMRAAVDFQGFLAVALPTIDISLSTGRSDEWCEGVCHATRLYREALEAQGLHIAPGEPPRNQRSDLIIGEPGAPADVRLGMRLIGDDELATVTITQHNKTITLNFTDSAHAARIADALQGYQPYAVVVDREEPTEPTPSAEPEAEELLPCPFCGGREAFVERADYASAYVQCTSMIDEHSCCMAQGPIGTQEDDGEDIPGAAAAIAEWNRRAAPGVQGEPVAEVSQETFSSDGTSDIITKNLPIGMKLYAAPQPAEQQPDVAQLVEALRMLVVAGSRLNDDAEECTHDDGMAEVAGSECWCEFRDALEAADAALAAYRKGG